MADAFEERNINPDIDSLDRTVVSLLVSATQAMLEGIPAEEITEMFGPSLPDLEDEDGRPIIPAAFTELAARTMENLLEMFPDIDLVKNDQKQIREEAENTWVTSKADAYIEPDHDVEIVAAELEDMSVRHYDNNFDSAQIATSIFLDEDVLRMSDTGMRNEDGTPIYREVTGYDFFNADGSMSDTGALSEKLFGPVQGASCSCGATRSGGDGGTAAGAVCPECGTFVLTSQDRKNSWGFMKSPIPLVFGREAVIGAMTYGLISIKGLDKKHRPEKAMNVIKSMAAGEMLYCCVDEAQWDEKRNTWLRKSVRITSADEAMELTKNPKEGQRFIVRYGTAGLEQALQGLRREYIKGDKYSALANADAYRRACMRVAQDNNEVALGFGKWTGKNTVPLQSESEIAYAAAYSLLEGRKAKPSQILLHFFPISPPGSRPINDLNGKTDLGEENEALENVLYELYALKETVSGRGYTWAGQELVGQWSKHLIKAVDAYLDVLNKQNSGKNGMVRGTMGTIKSTDVIRAVINPGDLQEPIDELLQAGLENPLPQTTVRLPMEGLRESYRDEVRNVMKAFGMDGETIAKEMKVAPETMVPDGNGGMMPCLADQAVEAVLAGYGDDGRDSSPIGKFFVSEGNRFGMTRSQARVRFAKEIRKTLHDEYGLDADAIRKEMLKPAGTLDSTGLPCLADTVLNKICRTNEGGRITALARDPIISTGSVQFMYIRPWNTKTIQIYPLVAKAFNADHDGDTMTAVKTLRKEANAAAKRLMSRAFQNDGTGSINQLAFLESRMGLHKMTQSFGERPDYSYKYGFIMTNRDALEKAGEVKKDGTVLRACDVFAHRIIERIDGVRLNVKPGDEIAPNGVYGYDKDGNPLVCSIGKASIAAQVLEVDGHMYLVDARPDGMRIPAGAKLSEKTIFEKNEPVATKRMFRGPLSSVVRELDRGRLTPQSTIELEEGDGTIVRTTAGRALMATVLPKWFKFDNTDERGIDKKRLEKILKDEMYRLTNEEMDLRRKKLEDIDQYDVADTVTQKVMKTASQIADFGYTTCSKYYGSGLSFLDYPQIAPIGLDDIFVEKKKSEDEGKEKTSRIRQSQREQYEKASAEMLQDVQAYMNDYNNNYLMDIVRSGEKNIALIGEMINATISGHYDKNETPFAVLVGGIATGFFGFSGDLNATKSAKDNNKTIDVDKLGELRNKMDEVMAGMMFEKGDCGTVRYLVEPLTKKDKKGKEYLDPEKVEALEGRTVARDVKDSKGNSIIPAGAILTKEMLENAYASGARRIPFRSAITCRCQGVCEKCAGAEANMLARPGDAVGNAVVSDLIADFTQGNLNRSKNNSDKGKVSEPTTDDVLNIFNGTTLKDKATRYLWAKKPEIKEQVDKIKKAATPVLPDRLEGAELSAVTMARIFKNTLRRLAKPGFPEVYLELIAKAYIFGYPSQTPEQDPTVAPVPGQDTVMSLPELMARDDEGRAGFFAKNPGLFQNSGYRTGIDATLDAEPWKSGTVMSTVKRYSKKALDKLTEMGTVYRNDMKRLLSGMYNRQRRIK